MQGFLQTCRRVTAKEYQQSLHTEVKKWISNTLFREQGNEYFVNI